MGTRYDSKNPMVGVTGYKEVNVKIDKPQKKRISVRTFLDRFCMIGIPVTVALIFNGLLALAAYSTVTHVWHRWVQVVNNSHVQKSIMTGTYTHGLTADIIYCSLLGIVALTITILCAYWAEAWYE